MQGQLLLHSLVLVEIGALPATVVVVLALAARVVLVVSFRTDLDGDVVDVTSFSALDVVEIKRVVLVVALLCGEVRRCRTFP